MTLSIAVLQTRSYSLDDRMIILGVIMRKISQFEENGEFEMIPVYVNSMMSALDSDELTAGLDKLEKNSMPVILNTYFSLCKLKKTNPHNINNLIDVIFENLGSSQNFDTMSKIIF